MNKENPIALLFFDCLPQTGKGIKKRKRKIEWNQPALNLFDRIRQHIHSGCIREIIADGGGINHRNRRAAAAQPVFWRKLKSVAQIRVEFSQSQKPVSATYLSVESHSWGFRGGHVESKWSSEQPRSTWKHTQECLLLHRYSDCHTATARHI